MPFVLPLFLRYKLCQWGKEERLFIFTHSPVNKLIQHPTIDILVLSHTNIHIFMIVYIALVLILATAVEAVERIVFHRFGKDIKINLCIIHTYTRTYIVRKYRRQIKYKHTCTLYT